MLKLAVYTCLLAVIWSLFLLISSSSGSEDEQPSMQDQIDNLKDTIGSLSRQIMLQQLFVEERIRSEGHSGLKQVRVNSVGDRPYRTASHIGRSVAAVHDHTNYQRTIGMGESIFVLNGVEFRTRHNDYKLNKPSNNNEYGDTEPIEFPNVPPAVTSKTTVQEQIVEMRKWFKAWRDQDISERDYTEYFKPILCYLEGAWTNPESSGNIDEPFDSERHQIDAESWFDLQNKIRFTSHSGRKSNMENYAFLPTSIMNVTSSDDPVFAQWNYRILCHPLNRDLKTNRLRVVDDFARRIKARLTLKQHEYTRQARFQLNLVDQDEWADSVSRGKYSLLDDLMAEIPGKDNYPGNLADNAFDLTAYKLETTGSTTEQQVNAAYYNRVYRVNGRGAMGRSNRHRGFSDENLFMAMTTQAKVAGTYLNDGCETKRGEKTCKEYNQKWSYAIPLEIIYLTPLSNWNPHEITYKGSHGDSPGNTITAGGRNGSMDSAYDGTNEQTYYHTPAAFFNGDVHGVDLADTTTGEGVWVLNGERNAVKTRASGIRIFLPSIPGVGVLRQRYPIMPVHGEGSAVWKELSAISDALLDSEKHLGLYRQSINTKPVPKLPRPANVVLQLGESDSSDDITIHTHNVEVPEYQVKDLQNGVVKEVTVTTTENNGHQHELVIRFNRNGKDKNVNGVYTIFKCGGKRPQGGRACFDHHRAPVLRRVSKMESLSMTATDS